MSQRVSRILFAAEVCLIAAPLSVLVVTFGAFWSFQPLFVGADWIAITIALLAALSFAALFAGWLLATRFLKSGRTALEGTARGWWLLAASGAALAVTAAASSYLPPSEPYSPMWEFRWNFGVFSTALPLLVPFAHRALVRLRSRRRFDSTSCADTAVR